MPNIVRSCYQRFHAMDSRLKLFLAGILLMGVAGGVFETTFNNYINDVFHVNAETRGMLEFPRELPGFLCVLMTGLLFFLPERSIAGICALVVGFGMIGLGTFGDEWWAMIAMTIFWSAGMHLMMPVRSSISMDLAVASAKGKRLGQVQAVGFAAAILGAGLVYLVLKSIAGKTDIQLRDYRPVFYIGGVAAILASAAFFSMKLHGAHVHRSRLIVRKRFWLFYVLALLFGARKQLFITFGPWVLIKIFHEPASTIAKLCMAGAVLQVFFQPFLGRLIDRWGERTVLLIDSLVLTFICAGYAASHLVGNPAIGVWVLYVCFVADMMMFGVNMARQTYVAKLSATHAEVSPTLSMGVTLDHAVSMSLPWLGGWVWETFGHSVLFVAAAGVAVLMATFSAMIPSKAKLHALEQQHHAGRT